MKLLMTGGLGFLGSHSIEKYESEGFEITIIDNLSSNVIEPTDELCKNSHVIIDDILNVSWDTLQDDFDVILHLASPVGPVGVLKHSGEMARYILDDIYWAIDGAKKFDCPLIFISTSEIYGYREKAEFLKEDDDKLLVGDFKVRNEYSMGKLLAEIVLSNTSKVSNLKYQIIRPFNISGPRQLKDGGFVLPTFTQQALKDEPITVFGDGEQIRAFTYVKDIVDGIYLTSVTNDHMNEIWNIGNGENVATIKHMAEKVKEFTNSKSEIVNVDPKTIHGPLFEEAWDKIPDSEKIKKLLGWESTLGVDEIIESVINFWRR
tara:strand:- start:2391 stop:3347 length:957 start_codon:yes stop_codon:yes gene_type:complete